MPINIQKFIVTIFLVFVSQQGFTQCLPALSEPPCAANLLNSNAQEPSLYLGVGNPIHLVTGNKHQTETDLPPNPNYPGLFIVRHYNSLNPIKTTLGKAWAFSYDIRIYQTDRKRWQIVLGNGQRFILPTQTHAGTLRVQADQLLWEWPNGQILTFNNDGYLKRLQWPNGNYVIIERYAPATLRPHAIKKIVNNQQQALHFNYTQRKNGQLLLAIATPIGTFEYVLDASQRLIQVQPPLDTTKHYLYEAHWQSGHSYALTGLVLNTGTQARRIRSWRYDSQGRAILSVLGDPDATTGRLEIHYDHPPTVHNSGLTRITNHRGEITNITTRLTPKGYRITRVKGSGCLGCPAPGTRATYDEKGHLQQINNTLIKRNAQGVITELAVTQSGWERLKLRYDANGQEAAWASQLTGWETIKRDANGQAIQREFANGDKTTVTYDAQQRPIHMTENHGNQFIQTRLSWHGYRLQRILHPHENEFRHYDQAGRIAKRHISRPNLPNIVDEFKYDKHHRLIAHHLDEGGILHYQWGEFNQLLNIYWEDKNGQQHRVISQIENQAGYQYGNELQLTTYSDHHFRTNALTVKKDKHAYFEQVLTFDQKNLVRHQHTKLTIAPDNVETFNWAYAYDKKHRLISLVSNNTTNHSSPEKQWLAWHDDGRAAAQYKDQESITHHPAIVYDGSGLPQTINNRHLHYDAHRRLQSVEENGRLLARYTHNAFGQTIRRETGQQIIDYDYVNNQLSAKRDRHGVRQRFIYAHHTPVGLIEYDHTTKQGHLFFIHADLLGAPTLVTDTQSKIVWAANYHPLGKATILKEKLTLDLRRPGQVYDSATGWHDNLLRTYLPEWGQYAEPDPLGAMPYNQAYGYALQQPHRYIDPLGLLLFAFDGTRQSIHTAGNVWKLSQLYYDGPSHYQSGPGNSLYVEWDALAAHNAHQIIENQWNWLLFELSRASPDDIIPIDIIGFSRGAALARHFGNLVAEHVNQGLFQYSDHLYGDISACVDLRFMGLFDSVAQFGIGGSQNYLYDFTIPSAWAWVAHAVALHEHRWLFPLLAANDKQQENLVEAPFIGAHSDIGGGVLPSEHTENAIFSDIANISLQWMLWQAQAASSGFMDSRPEDRTVEHPIIHDFRSKIARYVIDGDRAVQSSQATPWYDYQDQHPTLGKSRREEVVTFIKPRSATPESTSGETGIVDVHAYRQWLQDSLGWDNPPI